jgi:hypothetical protein
MSDPHILRSAAMCRAPDMGLVRTDANATKSVQDIIPGPPAACSLTPVPSLTCMHALVRGMKMCTVRASPVHELAAIQGSGSGEGVGT